MAVYDDDFERWWAAYPRKVGKRTAIKKWEIAVREIAGERNTTPALAMDWLLERTAAFAKSPKGAAGEFCPYPATWLHQGRYDDDPAEWGDQDVSNGFNRAAYLAARTPEALRKYRP